MDEMNLEDHSAQSQPALFSVGKREWIYGIICMISALCLANFVLYGGFALGFAVASLVLTLGSVCYLLSRGHKLTAYSGALLALSMVITAGFIRSDDSFVKAVMLCFLAVAENLGLCLLAGQNRRDPGGFSTLWDAPRAIFVLGAGKSEITVKSMAVSAKRSGKAGRIGGSLALGLVIALPLLAVVLILLMRADAAFSGLVELLPKPDFGQIVATVFFGAMGFFLVFPRAIAMHYSKMEPREGRENKGLYPLTVNTVLAALCLVYLVYLFSQLAYFVGGLRGILPKEFTMAEYARRGFFEMAWLCGINLATIAIGIGVVRKEKKAPLSTRLLCLFISIITLFFVVTASAKMGLYIGSFGLSRLRVLTEVIMIFLAITTILVAVWLFAPKLPYMKAVLLTALIMGALVFWVDVDSVVASYNVSAYQTGLLDGVDIYYLVNLSDGAVPYIARLAEDPDPAVAAAAVKALKMRDYPIIEGFRDWNYASHTAAEIIGKIMRIN